MGNILMKCGCAAQGYRTEKDGSHTYGCLVHQCYEQAEQPNLEGRTARCAYFGRTKLNRRYANDECNYGCRRQPKCECGSVPSRIDLAFFKYQPNKKYDEFYCGCMGWD